MNYRALGLLVLFCAGGCATTTTAPGDASSPVTVERRGNLSLAGEALLIQGVNERRAADYAAASATLERALRIEPSAPELWLELARVRLLEGNIEQARQLAGKARSLAGNEVSITDQADAILRQTSKQ